MPLFLFVNDQNYWHNLTGFRFGNRQFLIRSFRMGTTSLTEVAYGYD